MDTECPQGVTVKVCISGIRGAKPRGGRLFVSALCQSAKVTVNISYHPQGKGSPWVCTSIGPSTITFCPNVKEVPAILIVLKCVCVRVSFCTGVCVCVSLSLCVPV